MADTSTGQVEQYYGAMNGYFSGVKAYHEDPTKPLPNFMEVLPNLNFTQIITESQNHAKGRPTMVSGALIETASAVMATLREGAMRAKVRSDYFADAQGSASEDATYYQNQSQSMKSFISGTNDMQN
jgi:hypothetical protein